MQQASTTAVGSSDSAGRLADSGGTRADLMRALADRARLQAMLATGRARAWRRFGIRPDDADDLFQDAVATYLTVRDRYPSDADHFGLLFGIFRNQMRMFRRVVAVRARAVRRVAERLRGRRPDVARGEDPRGTTLDRIVREESVGAIRGVLASIPAERRTTRLQLIAATGVNPATFDTRLRAARLRLSRSLRVVGVA